MALIWSFFLLKRRNFTIQFTLESSASITFVCKLYVLIEIDSVWQSRSVRKLIFELKK